MFGRYKIFAAYLFAIPVALILGFLAASPGQTTFMLIGLLLFFLALPLFIAWHHVLLIFFWNSAFDAYFLPGQPNYWLIFALLSFALSFLNHIMGRRSFLPVPEMTRPLVFLAVVVVGTAFYRGGIGFEVLGGSARGSRYYVFVLTAIFGYFALTAAQIPIQRGQRMVGLFFLSGSTYVLSNIAYSLGPAFYFLYYFVPADIASGQAASDFGMVASDRIQGLAPACTAGVCFLLAHYGIRGLFNIMRPWRLFLFLGIVAASFLAGFRSVVALLFLVFVFQFYFEGLLRSRLFLVMIAVAVVCFVSVSLNANKMPLAMQRALSFLPINVDSTVRAEAMGSTEWRVDMWNVVWKDLPKYLVVGKGYGIDAGELDAVTEAVRLGFANSSEESLLAGDYHSGPLSVLIPFGMAGTVAFIWVLAAGFHVLYSNYRYGDERLRRVNTTLLSYYTAFVISFFLIFGALNSQLFVFLGLIGLSVSVNGGVNRKSTLAARRRDTAQQPYAIELN